MEIEDCTTEFRAPSVMWSRSDVLGRACPIPRSSGLYAWYFSCLPQALIDVPCEVIAGRYLLYAGISPHNDKSLSNVRTRIKGHFRGNASGSTLRLSLGCLLAAELGLVLRRTVTPKGVEARFTFGADGELRLNEWMADYAFVCWVSHPRPWTIEESVFERLPLPLNLEDNARNPFAAELEQYRADAREVARRLPVVPYA